MQSADQANETQECGSKWDYLAEVYARILPPLRPSPQDVETVRRAIADCSENVLLLGVTPAYAVLGQSLMAVDSSPVMIASIWPGDDERRRAQVGGWLNLSFADGHFSAVVGDGVLNAVHQEIPALLQEIRRVLAPGGVAAFRAFCSPEEGETLSSIRKDIMARPRGTPAALRFRIQMALAEASPEGVASPAEGLEACRELFPDIKELAARAGWDVEDVHGNDATRRATYRAAFPARSRMRAFAAEHFSNVRVIESDGYLMADYCPVFVMS